MLDRQSMRQSRESLVQHRYIDVGGVKTFYREAGTTGAPTILLPHGYPCSSFQFRNLIAGSRRRLAPARPRLPGFGYSETPASFAYDFDGYADFLERFTQRLGVSRYALYLHDYGSQIGLRLAIRHPDRISALVIQNGDIYRDALGPKYAGLLDYFADPTERASRSAAGSGERGRLSRRIPQRGRRTARRTYPAGSLEAQLGASEHAQAPRNRARADGRPEGRISSGSQGTKPICASISLRR